MSRLDKRHITEQLAFWETDDVWQSASVKKIRLPAKLTDLRQKLYQKAKLEPEFRFYALYDRVFRRDVLSSAYQIVRANKGKAGVDGVTFDDIESSAGGIEGFLDDIQESLRAKAYRPMAVRRVWIPKPDGRKRPLGIPTIRGRVVQMAVLLVIEPIFEADFMDCSYGFRPGRSAHDALGEVQKHLEKGLNAVYDADLKGYFDSIPHDKLIKCLRMRIVDRSVLKLIRMWLKAPIVEQGRDGGRKITRSKKGTPQGGVISPLLANVYLHWFEKVFYSDTGPGWWANYFNFGYPRKAMRAMNWYVRGRLIQHLRRRSQRPFRPPEGRSFYEHLKKLGLIYL